MKPGNDRWETAGSLTPELEGTPRSGSHKSRASSTSLSSDGTQRPAKKKKAGRQIGPDT